MTVRDHRDPIPLREGFETEGALPFRDSHVTGIGHVAVSMGDNRRTFEAMGSAYGVRFGRIHGRTWTSAGLAPEVDYGASKEAQPRVERAVVFGKKAGALASSPPRSSTPTRPESDCSPFSAGPTATPEPGSWSSGRNRLIRASGRVAAVQGIGLGRPPRLRGVVTSPSAVTARRPLLHHRTSAASRRRPLAIECHRCTDLRVALARLVHLLAEPFQDILRISASFGREREQLVDLPRDRRVPVAGDDMLLRPLGEAKERLERIQQAGKGGRSSAPFTMTSTMPEPLLGRAPGGPDPTRHAQSVECAAPHRIRGTTGRPPRDDRRVGELGRRTDAADPGAGQDSILVAITAGLPNRIRRAPSPTASPIEEPISAPAMTSPG